jgi:hypothetical protein
MRPLGPDRIRAERRRVDEAAFSGLWWYWFWGRRVWRGLKLWRFRVAVLGWGV